MLLIYWELKQHNEILNKTAFYQFQGILFKLLFYTNYILFLSQNLILFKVTLIKQLETTMAYICYNNKPIQVSAIAIKSLHSEIINMWLYACQTPAENAGLFTVSLSKSFCSQILVLSMRAHLYYLSWIS